MKSVVNKNTALNAYPSRHRSHLETKHTIQEVQNKRNAHLIDLTFHSQAQRDNRPLKSLPHVGSLEKRICLGRIDHW